MIKFWRMAAALVMASVGALLVASHPAGATSPGTSPGYWLAGADGGVFSFHAPFLGSGSTPAGPCTYTQALGPSVESSGCAGIAATPAGDGYWLLNRYRYPTAFGRAAQLGQANCSGYAIAGPPWTGITSSATGDGFLLTSPDGADVPCGDAVQISDGLEPNPLAAPAVGIVSTSDGKGYWIVAADGGVFAIGDAGFEGSLGGTHLNAPVVGIAPTPDNRGYWLVASDGGVFAFGDAVFFGSMGGTSLNAPVVGVAAAPDGAGYWLAAADGGVFSFGSAPYQGSMGGKAMTAPVVGIAAYSGAISG